MADTHKVVDTVNEIVADANVVLEIIAAVDPEVGGEVVAAGKVAGLLASLVTKALTAYAAAADTPITPETVAALMPNPVPLTEPDAV